MLNLPYIRTNRNVYISGAVLQGMRYTLTNVSGKARRAFKLEVVYDDREITRLAKRDGLKVTRPNGDTRIRGSSRLQVWDGKHIVARFEKQVIDEKRVIKPVPVAVVRGRLI